MTDRAHAPSVLVVDDESGILQTLEILLRAEGFTPHVAHGGKAALELIPQLSPDIVLSDVRMPQVTGVEVAPMVKLGAAVTVAEVVPAQPVASVTVKV